MICAVERFEQDALGHPAARRPEARDGSRHGRIAQIAREQELVGQAGVFVGEFLPELVQELRGDLRGFIPDEDPGANFAR